MGGLLLKAMVIAAIRQHPKCERVTKIAITPVEILDIGRSWHIQVIDAGGADMQLAITVAREVRESLEPKCEVVD